MQRKLNLLSSGLIIDIVIYQDLIGNDFEEKSAKVLGIHINEHLTVTWKYQLPISLMLTQKC